MALMKHPATNSFHKVHLENEPSILLSPNTAFASAPASDVMLRAFQVLSGLQGHDKLSSAQLHERNEYMDLFKAY